MPLVHFRKKFRFFSFDFRQNLDVRTFNIFAVAEHTGNQIFLASYKNFFSLKMFMKLKLQLKLKLKLKGNGTSAPYFLPLKTSL